MRSLIKSLKKNNNGSNHVAIIYYMIKNLRKSNVETHIVAHFDFVIQK